MQRKVMSILGTLFFGTIYLLTLCIILLAADRCSYIPMVERSGPPKIYDFWGERRH